MQICILISQKLAVVLATSILTTEACKKTFKEVYTMALTSTTDSSTLVLEYIPCIYQLI